MIEQLKTPRPDHVGHRRRLREKFFKAGSDGLHDYETLELLLTFVIPRIDTKPLAKRLIQKFGSFARVLDASLEKLREVEGMGNYACSLFPILKSSMELYLSEGMKQADALNSPEAVIRYCRVILEGEKNEIFLVLYLSSKNRVIGIERLSEGTIDHAPVYPRRIIEGALKANAAGIIFVHNHPSGDPAPSPQDKSLTQEIAATAKPLGIAVHDHLIIGKGGYFSFRASGLIGFKQETISNGI
ncbi:MAG: DNA repair protein RadC [Elusimicrobiota bacterium]